MATTSPTQPGRRSVAHRGLRNKQNPSQLSLLDPSPRGRVSAGSYLNMLPKEPAPIREPRCLAAPSVHSSANDSRRGLMASQSMRSSRRGPRQNIGSMVRKVSESSLFCSGSGHSSLDDRECILDIPDRPGLSREVSGLGESSRSFFCDDHAMQQSSQALDVPPEVTSSPSKSNNNNNNNNSYQEHRTLEDISMQAQSEYGDQEEESYEMEISPGVYLPFRGSQETWRAVYNGNTLETTCLECGLELVSVPDCQCVVCSDCRMVNPVFEHPRGVTEVHGAGMGLHKEWIQQRGQDRDFSRR